MTTYNNNRNSSFDRGGEGRAPREQRAGRPFPQRGGSERGYSASAGRGYGARSTSSFGRAPRPFPARSRKIAGSSIDITKLVQKAKPIAETKYDPKHIFSDFELDQKIKDNVLAKGYIHPTAIQDQAIPHVLRGADVLGLANTGTGKTAAFLLPLLDKIMKDREQLVLIVVPTRELAIQIQQEFIAFARGLHISATLCIGGAPIRFQMLELKRIPNVIIGTPGRIKDLIERRAMGLANCETIVLDEADRMLDMGFIDDMKYLLSLMPKKKQTLLFSATMSKEVGAIVQEFQNNPVTISVRTGDTSANVDQDVIRVSGKEHKMDVLHDLLNDKAFSKVIIFCRTKRGTEQLEKELTARGFSVDSIHGDKTQGARSRSIRLFKEDKIQALIATDVAARGLDIPAVSHVINFELPQTYEDYTHRIGRTGRAGKAGVALTFIG